MCKHERLAVGLATNHDAIDVLQVSLHVGNRLDASVDDNLQLGILPLQAVDTLVDQRRYVAVLLRVQTLEERLRTRDTET